MSAQPRRCPSCLNVMPLARRRCPYCHSELPTGDATRSLEVVYLQDELSGKFEIISEIHRRGIGVTFLAHDLRLDREVVIKSLKFGDNIDPNRLALWIQNVRRATRLDHPNITRNYTFGRAGPLHYFLMEYLEFPSLESLLHKGIQLPLWQCLSICKEIASGIHAAHNLGIAHHRLKPSNVLVLDFGRARVIDLGSAQNTIDSLDHKPWSVEKEPSFYMAPEQIESGVSDNYSDQYSLGIILFHMLTGVLPFPDPGEYGAMRRITEQPPSARKLISHIPESLDEILKTCLAVNPDDRYPNCQELADQLQSLDPEIWISNIDKPFQSTTKEATVSRLMDGADQAARNREFHRADFLAGQALALAPYHPQVTEILVRSQKLKEREEEVQCVLNNSLTSFYEHRLDDALRVLSKAKQLDRENPEVMRLTHDILQEQERRQLTRVLLETARIDIEQDSLTPAMAKIVKIQEIDPGNATAAEYRRQIESAMEDRSSLEVLYSKAEEAFVNENIKEAESILSEILELDPQHTEASDLQIKIADWKRKMELVSVRALLHEQTKKGLNLESIQTLQRIAELEPRYAEQIHKKIHEIKQVLVREQTMIIQVPQEPPAPQSADSFETVILMPDSEETEVISTVTDPVPEAEDLPLDADGPDQDLTDEIDGLDTVTDRIPSEDDDSTVIISVDEISELEKALPFSLVPEEKKKLKFLWIVLPAAALMAIFIIIFLLILPDDQDPAEIMETDTPIPTAVHVAMIEPTVTETPTPEATTTPTPTPTPTKTQVLATPIKHPSGVKYLQKKVKRAQNLELSGAFTEAKQLYMEVLRDNRTNLDAQGGLARCDRMLARKERYPSPSRRADTRVPNTWTPVPTSRPKTPTPTPLTSRSGDVDVFAIESVILKPNPPVAGKSLKVSIRIHQTRDRKVTGIWINYKVTGDTGYEQIFIDRPSKRATGKIPGNAIQGAKLYYFISAADQNGMEVGFGSADNPRETYIIAR